MLKRLAWLAGAVAVACLGLAGAGAAPAFELRSPDVSEGATLTRAQVYFGSGCYGDNLSPALAWSGAPAGTQSFAVTVYDPDAPTGSGWWHWVVFDIPASVTALPRGVGHSGALPPGARQARNDFGSADFGGACPPPGNKAHRYIFTVHALKRGKLDVPPDAAAARVGAVIDANRIDKASITARYGR
jgi:Raf kinase inhibitor-like YbhB/YbcL family protein